MNRQRLIFAMIFVQCALTSTCVARGTDPETLMKLSKWERGVKVESRTDKAGFAYFWFYEWHLFDAVAKGEHTHGSHEWKCMHLSVRVGPLKQGQTKTIRGRIYLFKRSKEDCLKQFRKDFSK